MLVDFIIAIVEKMRECHKEKAITVLKLAKSQAEFAKKLYKSQVKLAFTANKKAMIELIDCYVSEENLLI